MIRRFFACLLVVLMPANQGLCLAHMHHGHGAAAPEGHDSRPHFHLVGHGHHGSGHGHHHGSHDHAHHSRSDAPNPSEHSPTAPCGYPPLGDHDSDAVYGGETVALARTGNSVNILPGRDAVVTPAILLEHGSDELTYIQVSHGRSSFLGGDACPIYLRALSLRL